MPSAERTDGGLWVDPALREFLATEVLPGTGLDAERFLSGLTDAISTFGPRNEALLARRLELQSAIDDWHVRQGGPGEPGAYRTFLEEIGYLVPAGDPFTIATEGVDREIRALNGPQLVVPITNARYALNAVNARWGSLYDALYGTDALGEAPSPGPYDPDRGALVVAWVKRFLDEVVPLADGSHIDVTSYEIGDGRLVAVLGGDRPTGLADPSTLVGHTGSADRPTTVVLSHHGLGIELRIDRGHPVGRTDPAGVADVVLEAALTTIADLEDSVACVDGPDKVEAYRNLLGLTTGELTASVIKDGASFERSLADDRRVTTPDGGSMQLRGRSLLLVRTVGHLMTTPAARAGDREIPEGILDTFVVAAIALHDRRRPKELRNSRHGSVYLVKPKMHGPEEVAFACEVLAAAEQTVGMEPNTLKIGIMDEERRTTLNLEACIRAAKDRVVFVNTGFLDRTGDEIHTSMRAGPMLRKPDMKATRWIRAYEENNVEVALRCGFAGRAQIGKGMWAMPDRMADMLDQKIGHPLAGANCAWVPSPTAATLHATHYHRIDVPSRQRELPIDRASLHDLLDIPVVEAPTWGPDEVAAELDNNIQGILGYVVRWVDQGIGCSKVPDTHDVGLMEDRATCRISSQHVGNWLLHGVVSSEEVDASLRRMAVVVDRQNGDDPQYRPMSPGFDGVAFAAARDLIFGAVAAPSGYTEPALHAHRLAAKHPHSGATT